MKLQRLRKRKPFGISKGYQNYSKIEDCTGKRLFFAIIPKSYIYILDIDFGYYDIRRFWLEIVLLGIGVNITRSRNSLPILDNSFSIKFRNDYRR